MLSFQGREDRQHCRKMLWTEYVCQCGNEEAASTLVIVLRSICNADEDQWVLWYIMLDEELNFRRSFDSLGPEKACDKIESITPIQSSRVDEGFGVIICKTSCVSMSFFADRLAFVLSSLLSSHRGLDDRYRSGS